MIDALFYGYHRGFAVLQGVLINRVGASNTTTHTSVVRPPIGVDFFDDAMFVT
jgi:hypothetical protein